MRQKLLTCVAAFLAIHSAYAETKFPKPKTCPSVAAIKAVGLGEVTYGVPFGWKGLILNNRFDTAENWDFLLLMASQAKNTNAAIIAGNAEIGLLALDSGPFQEGEGQGPWTCSYMSNGENFPMAFAVSPPNQGMLRFRR